MNLKALSWIILIVLSCIWGSSFILMKRGLEAYSSEEVAALRISIAFLILLPLQLKYYKINFKKHFFGLLLMGVFGNLIPAFLFTKAETQISSSLTGMLNGLTPLFTILVSFLWLKIKPSKSQSVTILIGFIAAVCLLFFQQGENIFKNAIFGLLVILATFCYALSINGIKKYLNDLNSISATVWSFTITGPIALFYLFGFTNFTNHFAQHPKAIESLNYVFILAILGSAISVIFYNYLIKSAGIIFASSCTYLIPIVAVAWGLLDGESINFIQILSLTIIILSVYLINRDRKFV